MAEAGAKRAKIVSVRLRELMPTREEWRQSAAPIVRGSVLGFFTGLIPGPGRGALHVHLLRASRSRSRRRRSASATGAIEGVAGPEAANNAATAGAMVPLLSLGIPFSPATAILLGALVIHRIQPGPLLISQRPEVFWGVIASMYVGNVLLLILNLPLVGRIRERAAPAPARARDAGAPALPGRRLQPEQQPARPLGAGRLRRLRLRAPQARDRSRRRWWSRWCSGR